MDIYKMLLCVIFISGCTLVSFSVSQGLSNLVANVGENVTFTFSNGDTTNMDFYYWRKYNPTPTNIQSKGMSTQYDTNKYIVGMSGSSFSLTIKNIVPEDGLTYCFFSSKLRNESCGNLVVIGSLTPSVNPSTGLTVGQQVNLTCTLQYGGPTTDTSNVKPLSADQTPELSMSIGSTQIDNIPPGQMVIGDNQSPVHSKTISVNRTIMATDLGQPFICKVTTKNPAFSKQATLDIEGPTTEVRIDYVNKTNNNGSPCCRVNDILNCTANGVPYPTITWKDDSGRDIKPIDSETGNGFAAVVVSRQGKYTWSCSAKNNLTPVVQNTSITIDTKDDPSVRGVSGSTSLHVLQTFYAPMIMYFLVSTFYER